MHDSNEFTHKQLLFKTNIHNIYEKLKYNIFTNIDIIYIYILINAPKIFYNLYTHTSTN